MVIKMKKEGSLWIISYLVWALGTYYLGIIPGNVFSWIIYFVLKIKFVPGSRIRVYGRLILVFCENIIEIKHYYINTEYNIALKNFERFCFR